MRAWTSVSVSRQDAKPVWRNVEDRLCLQVWHGEQGPSDHLTWVSWVMVLWLDSLSSGRLGTWCGLDSQGQAWRTLKAF